jgi:RNA polymerase-interacting CarD/CdnL/TRCF family regulator
MTPSSGATPDAVLSARVECVGADGVGASWEIGAAVFCPGRGLGLVVGRAVCAPLGTPREYLTIYVQRVGMTIRVPVDRAAELGLRPPASPQELKSWARPWTC